MKVDQQHRAAAAHHPVRRDRRVDAARQQAGDAAAGAGRQAAGARLLAEEVERMVRQHLEVDASAPARSRSTRQPVRSLMQAADFALDLRRGERKPLVGAPRAARGTTPACRSPRSRRIAAASASKSCGAAAGIREVGDAEHVPHAVARPRPRRRPAPSSISIRPMTDRTPTTSRPASAARRLRTSICTNHGRFRPLSASSL